MADFTRLNRYRAELKKMRERRAEMDGKIKDMERRCKEEEKTMIHDIVHEANMTPEDLAALIGMNGAEKLDAINGMDTMTESEVESNDEEDF